MASLVKTPQSEITATLEVLGCLGITTEHLALLRSNREYAESIAEFMVHQKTLETILTRAYALNFTLVARILIELLKPKLSLEELKYIDEYGPKIVREYYLHDVYTRPGGCDEGRAARRKAEALEKLSKEKLTDAGVSEERQKLLGDLVFSANADYLTEFPPKEIADTLYHMQTTFQKGKLTRLNEIAVLLNAPAEIQIFLTLLREQANKLELAATKKPEKA